jgi:hypothetical protein
VPRGNAHIFINLFIHLWYIETLNYTSPSCMCRIIRMLRTNWHLPDF